MTAKECSMNKVQVNGIVIAAGTIVTFFLIRFLRIPPPLGQYVAGRTLSPNAVRYCIRGSMYIDKKDYDKAIEDFSEAISLDPTDPDAYNGRSLAYDHKNETAKAVEDFTQVLRLDPAGNTTKKFLAAISLREGRKY
jgi:tetratricopeptide (TPR) repeat protein